jgi:hypothetical protein
MSDEHKCHCPHVVVVMTKLSIVEKLLAIAIVGVIGVGGTLAGQFISNRLSWRPPPESASERLFLDRVSKPDVQPVRP